ncbi:MAG: ATP-binding protein, partial [Planctomycetota bacterium]
VQSGAKETGLSLAIAKQIVCTHGGQIIAVSRPGRGTTFRVTLPVENIR